MAGALLRNERIAVLAALAVTAAVAWAYLLAGAGMAAPAGGGRMAGMGGAQMMRMAPAWTPAYAVLIFTMWATMMVAMMLPSAAPTVLLASAVMRERRGNRVFGPTGLFVVGYLCVWVAFSLVATLAQWGLSNIGLLSAGMASKSGVLAGLLLIGAGLYQFAPFKQACLVRCRSPAEQLTRYWPRGAAGPWLAGLSNGAYCLGCCWLLMSLLFVGGVMNVGWIALLACVVLMEKVLPASPFASRLTGLALLAWGALVLVR